MLLCWKRSEERTGWHGTSQSRFPPSGWVLAGSFLLALKGVEQLPQLFFPIIDATWKESGVSWDGLSLGKGVGGARSGVACTSTIWSQGGIAGAMQPWVAYGLHLGSTPEVPWPLSRSFSYLSISFLICKPGYLLHGISVRIIKRR